MAEGFFSRLSFGMIGFTLPLYAYEMGLGMTAIGLLVSLSVMCEMALKPFTAPLADRFGAKRTLGAALGLRSVVALFLALSYVPWQLFAIRALHGASESMRDPSVNVLIAEHGGRKTIATSFAWYSTAKVVAGAVGRSSAGVLLTLTGTNYLVVFVAAFVASFLPLLVIARYVEDSHIHSETATAPAADVQQEQAPPAEPAPSMRRAFGFGVLITTTATMLGNLFPLLATQYAGLTEAEAGIVYLVSVLVILFAGPFFGWLSDHVSRKLVLSLRGFANTVSSVLYIVFPDFWGVMSARVVDDMGKAAFRPAWGELMARIAGADRRRRARNVGRLSLAENIGETVGPLIAGLLWQTWGITAMLAVRAALAIVTELYALLVMEGARRPRNEGDEAGPPGGKGGGT
jgi:MFS family permease